MPIKKSARKERSERQQFIGAQHSKAILADTQIRVGRAIVKEKNQKAVQRALEREKWQQPIIWGEQARQKNLLRKLSLLHENSGRNSASNPSIQKYLKRKMNLALKKAYSIKSRPREFKKKKGLK